MAQRSPKRFAPVLPLLLLLVGTLTVALPAAAATRNNDDSCDIAVLPAATLLLPYFEVDLDYQNGESTIFTVANVTNTDAIARVTIWTDRAFPVLSFNIYLTGYDVQAINLFDVFHRGLIAPDGGTGTKVQHREDYSIPNTRLDLTACERLPGQIDEHTLIRLQEALTEGRLFPYPDREEPCEGIGGEHDHATGYLTIDVVANCSNGTPLEEDYWKEDIRYDNVLTGDYQQVNSAQDSAQGGPLVHIRAIPEGGTPRERRVSNDAGFPRTFYARYQSPLTPGLDGRQPLPSQFAVRWIQGGDWNYETWLKIWREGRAGTDATCEDYANDDALAVREIVVFDEDENAAGSTAATHRLPATSRTNVGDADAYPQLAGAGSGWMYVNLDRSAQDGYASQGWIVSSMRSEGRYSVDFDAVALGNGCSAPVPRSEVTAIRGTPIGPAPNESHRRGTVSTDNDDNCDVALLPAATLLLPYFEVDLDSEPPSGPPTTPPRDPTIFTVINVSPNDQIARVTLWTDYSFPVLSFNIYLTGYDAQSINLYDVIERGIVAPQDGTGTRLSDRGRWSDRNPGVDLGACGQLPGRLSEDFIIRMQSAFTEGFVPDMGELAGCDDVGNVHEHATGYATIDLVRNCSPNTPFAAEYWTEDLAYDNVLIGDYQQVDPNNDFAQGGPLVHIRAVPEGGTVAERRALPRKYDAGFPHTFYSRYQSAAAPKLDGRQPLPSVFAARWISGSASDFDTFLKIFREGKTGLGAACNLHDENVVKVMEAVVFDEQENARGAVPVSRICTPIETVFTLAATSLSSIRDSSVFPQPDNGSIAGWLYLNLDHCEHKPWASSNWVISSMRAEGRHSVDVEAAALGNGCSPDAPLSEVTAGSAAIGPRPNANP